MFWGSSAYAITYTDHVDFEDNCNHKISLVVTRTLSNVSGECGLVKCDVNIVAEDNSGQYIDEYKNMIWDNGNATAQIYDFNTSAYFFYPNDGIYGVDFSVDIVTYCGTFHYVFTPPEYDNSIVVIGCTEYACASSFNYCEFYLDLDDADVDWPGQMPMLESVSYIDPSLGAQILDETNNSGGIFRFPYYSRGTDCPNTSPNLHDFVNDMNIYLNQSGIGGVCELNHIGGPYYCKEYVGFLNTGVFFYEIGIKDCWFKYVVDPFPNCKTKQDLFLKNPVYPSPDFPILTACLPLGIINDNSDINKATMDKIKDIRKLALNNELEKKTGVRCYPNITSTEFFIENSLNNKYRVDIYSVSGQLIKQFDFYNQMKKIDVSDFNQGMYIIRFRDLEKGGTQVEKLIVQ